jgi:sugar phosphate isomerase/epimerase
MKPMSRREAMALLAAPAAARAQAAAARAQAAAGGGRLTIAAFSKHFHWADLPETADTCARLGYEGVDLTVRKGGHIAPERVEEDLPKAVETIRKAGLSLPMITTDIADTQSPHAAMILKTMAALRIPRYRWGGFRYTGSAPVPEELAGFKARVKDLAAMNKQYGVCAMYHTHSGRNQVGASMWDLYLLLKDFSPEHVSANYDIGHATVEGGFGGWLHSARLMLPFTRGIAVKDFVWKKDARRGWVPGWCGLGQGMVNFKEFFGLVRANGFSGPVQLHMEYDELGGADRGLKAFTIPKEKLLGLMKRDLDTLKSLLAEAKAG